MKRILPLLSFLIWSQSLWSQNIYDSIRNILEYSDKKSDFIAADSILNMESSELNTPEEKNLVYVGAKKSKQLNFELLYGKFTLRESIIETIHGNYGEAIALAKEALKIFSKYNSIHATACYNTIGGMVSHQGDKENAIRYLEKAFKICALFPDSNNKLNAMCNNHLMLGNIYISMGLLNEGEHHTKRALLSAQQNGYLSSEIYANLNLSSVEKKRDDFAACYAYLKKALELSKSSKAYNLEALAEIKIAEMYAEMGKSNAALINFEKGETIALKQQLNDRLLSIYKSMSEIYVEKGDIESAYAYQHKYLKLYELQKQKEKKEQLGFLQVQFNVSEKNAQINALALEKAHERSERKLLEVAIIITITAFVLLVLIIILIFNRIRLNKKIQIERQEKELVLYHMMALKSQMNPHFIFNALNSIQELILKEKTEESYTYITKFANLVRKTLNYSNVEFIDLEEEMESIQLYLELEKLRFKNDVKMVFDPIHADDIQIPPLLIQPFIENAIKHGLLHKKGEKTLHITFELKDTLICTIRDNGVGRSMSKKIQNRRAKAHTSFATKSIENRFELLRKTYGGHLGIKYIDHLSEGEPTGTTVILTIPYKKKF